MARRVSRERQKIPPVSKPTAVYLDVEQENGETEEAAEDEVGSGFGREEGIGLEEEEGRSEGSEEVVHADGMREFGAKGMGAEEAAEKEEEGEDEEGEESEGPEEEEGEGREEG